ncbi:hypothetical protein [Actinomadura oligospora]|uniref:hypothetical protein n=1 Tax=Actinomadura oligospora TaxID=111804 RepID=UPI000479F8FF|nr:hypothetical protein [Actinomadura oligospora]
MAGEVGQVIPVMKALQELATTRRMLIVGDSKLISYANHGLHGRRRRDLRGTGVQDLGARHRVGPLAVAALFLKNNRRIAALVTVICLALLIFCLIERQVRRSLAEQGTTRLECLYAGRPAVPTGRLILQALATMKIIPGRGQDPPIIPRSTPVQLRLLDLLDIDPRQLR